MNIVPAKEVYKLDGAVVPQLFIERDGDIYFFDKINPHEGRFCRLENNEIKIVLEVGEGQGIISHRGEIYLLQIGTSTVISKYKLNGQREKNITMDGIFFDFKINESGYFICLGYVENETVIKILSNNGLECGIIRLKSVLFGSCIALYDDDIYIGGFDEKNVFILVAMNYIGSIQNKWTIDVNSEDRIIGKIQRYKKYILLHIVGKYDSLVILNTENGFIKELMPQDLGLKNFIDVNLNQYRMQVLDEKCIYSWNLDDIVNISPGTKRKGKVEDFNPSAYQYLMYMKGLRKETIGCLKISFIVLSIILGYLQYNELLSGISPTKVIVLSLSCLWVLNFTIALTKNIIAFMDKSKRIDELLDIYSLKFNGKDIILPLSIGLNVVCFSILLLYPNFNFLLVLFFGIIFSILTYFINIKVTKGVASQNKNISIELLSCENSDFGEYLKAVIENIKDKNCEGVFIDITLNNSINKERIERWIRSRKNILGTEPKIFMNGNLVKIEFDLSKRDVKYSRYSILMDCICYIEKEGNIKEIQIGPLEN